jgi:hypothetical protein
MTYVLFIGFSLLAALDFRYRRPGPAIFESGIALFLWLAAT